MRKDKVSVIVPVYKTEKYIRTCIESILNQTWENLEIIVVDDGSPDNGGVIAEQYAVLDERIKVIHQNNMGLSEARNSGLREATGDWILFVDSDDEIPRNAVESLWTAAQREQAAISMGGYMICTTRGKRIKKKQVHVHSKVFYDRENMHQYFLSDGKNFNYVWMKLYRKDIFNKIKFEKGKYYEDIYIFPDIIEAAGSIVIEDSPIYNYWVRKNSITTESSIVKHMDGLEAREKWQERVREKYPQLLPYSADAILEFCCYLLGKMVFQKRKNNLEYWEKILVIFRTNQSLARKKTLYQRMAVLLFHISPYLLGVLCNVYLKVKAAL